MAEVLTLDGELDRQYKAVRRGEASAVVCPWCGGRISELDPEDCCDELTEARKRLAQAHLQRIRQQREAIRNGIQTDPSIQCPYCDAINRPENVTEDRTMWKRPNVNPYCCDSMFSALMRLSDHQAIQDQIDEGRRIQDNFAKVGWN